VIGYSFQVQKHPNLIFRCAFLSMNFARFLRVCKTRALSSANDLEFK